MGNCLGREKPKATGQRVNGHAATPSGPPGGSEAFPPVNKTLNLQISLLGRRRAEDVTEVYDIGEVLGAGQFGTTRVAVHKETGEKFACKSINKSRVVGMDDIANVKQELQIMHHMAGHPNIVSLKEAFEDHVYVHLIMELCEGGDLVDRIVARGRYTERDAAALVRTILQVVAFCHELGVMHRDLKPDNFLLDGPSEAARLKATDFGMSCFFTPGGERLHDVCGTAYYMAPEILMRDYDERADVWACGVILYILLCGRPPFEAVRDEDIFRMIVEVGIPDFTSHLWDNITEPAKDCVRQMMTYDPKKRPSAREALEHPWVREGGLAGDNVIEPEVLHRMRSFAAMNRLKKEALLFIGQRLSPDEIRGLRQLFESMDADGSGTINVQELRDGLASRGGQLPDGELRRLMELADVDGDKELDYGEWVAATMHCCRLQQEQHLVEAFKHFDQDNSGYITRDELEGALRHPSLAAAQVDADIQKVMAECDKDGDGRLDYAEFVSMLLPRDAASQRRVEKYSANWAKSRQHDAAGKGEGEGAGAADAAAAPDQQKLQAAAA